MRPADRRAKARADAWDIKLAAALKGAAEKRPAPKRQAKAHQALRLVRAWAPWALTAIAVAIAITALAERPGAITLRRGMATTEVRP